MFLNNFFFFLSQQTRTHTLSLFHYLTWRGRLCYVIALIGSLKDEILNSKKYWEKNEVWKKSRNARVSIVELSCEEISSILRWDAFLKYNTFVGRIKSRRRSKKNHRLKSGLGRKPKRVEVTLSSRSPDRKHTPNNTWRMSRSRG